MDFIRRKESHCLLKEKKKKKKSIKACPFSPEGDWGKSFPEQQVELSKTRVFGTSDHGPIVAICHKR